MSLDRSTLVSVFASLFPAAPKPTLYFCPGRVNLIGEHIDYNGGYVFPAALTIGTAAALAPRGDQQVVLKSMNAEGTITLDLTEALVYDKADGWGNYPKGVFAYLMQEGRRFETGFDILYWGDLPDGAGLSSSAAIEVLTAWMLCHQLGEPRVDRVWLARFCQRVENQFVGVNSGIMDQFSVALGQKDQAILLDCNSLDYQYVPFQAAGHKLVIMNTHKRRELGESKYNERRSECEAALLLIQEKYPSVKDLCAATLAQVEECVTEATLKARARHVVSENQRVLQAVEALKAGDLSTFGQLLDASHFSLRDDYEVTGKELDAITEAARQQPGCLGARMTGAGFGGCAIALVTIDTLGEFLGSVGHAYTEATGRTAEFYISEIGDGVGLM